MIKKLNISIRSINLKEKFKDIHHVEITGISSFDNEYAALLTIWDTEEYKSLFQQIVVFDKLQIINKYRLSKNLKWNCIYSLNDGSYLLGSKFSSLYSGAALALFKDKTIVMSKKFDTGYATEISTIQADNDGSLLIKGSWYKCVPCGGHDDYFPEPWQRKITIESSGFIEDDLYNSYQNSIRHSIPDSDLNPENYYVLEDFGISKYNNDDQLMWNQGLGHIGSESLQPIHTIVPFFKTQNGETIQDGVWFSGADHTNSDRSLSEPLFGRITAGGTIQSFKDLLFNFPEIYKIYTIIPGMDNNCLLIVETLIIGEGSGLCLFYNHFSEGSWQQDITVYQF
ncbi:hypothetical protein [Flavobacterium piscis]|uniref:Uncharacterized protein n=1 Tax=Flavobacterium piscis TaxID=1114874 RepID=A0ABU1YCX1_9FLAO|nr:hypothetical protein [Flavobacterium piscis]MDR7212092.1 hypothetical protein [Flavobacterium piscis]